MREPGGILASMDVESLFTKGSSGEYDQVSTRLCVATAAPPYIQGTQNNLAGHSEDLPIDLLFCLSQKIIPRSFLKFS